MTKPNHISDIIEVLNSGIEFYEKGIEKVSNPELKSVFQEMISEKRKAISTLQPFAREEQGEEEHDGSAAVAIREKFTQLLSVFQDDNKAYVSQLEEVEDKVLEEFRSALKDEQPADCQSALRSTMTDMRACHDKMRSLKWGSNA